MWHTVAGVFGTSIGFSIVLSNDIICQYCHIYDALPSTGHLSWNGFAVSSAWGRYGERGRFRSIGGAVGRKGHIVTKHIAHTFHWAVVTRNNARYGGVSTTCLVEGCILGGREEEGTRCCSGMGLMVITFCRLSRSVEWVTLPGANGPGATGRRLGTWRREERIGEEGEREGRESVRMRRKGGWGRKREGKRREKRRVWLPLMP